MQRRGEEADYGKKWSDSQDREAEIIDIFVPVLTGDGRERFGCFKGVGDIVVGNVEVDRFVRISW